MHSIANRPTEWQTTEIYTQTSMVQLGKHVTDAETDARASRAVDRRLGVTKRK